MQRYASRHPKPESLNNYCDRVCSSAWHYHINMFIRTVLWFLWSESISYRKRNDKLASSAVETWIALLLFFYIYYLKKRKVSSQVHKDECLCEKKCHLIQIFLLSCLIHFLVLMLLWVNRLVDTCEKSTHGLHFRLCLFKNIPKWHFVTFVL